MVINEQPCIARCLDVGKDLFQVFKKMFLVSMVSNNFSALGSLDDNVVESTGRIYAGASWHAARSACPLLSQGGRCALGEYFWALS